MHLFYLIWIFWRIGVSVTSCGKYLILFWACGLNVFCREELQLIDVFNRVMNPQIAIKTFIDARATNELSWYRLGGRGGNIRGFRQGSCSVIQRKLYLNEGYYVKVGVRLPKLRMKMYIVNNYVGKIVSRTELGNIHFFNR